MILITGSGGLVGSACAYYFMDKGHEVIGIDNNSRLKFFGFAGNVDPTIIALVKEERYTHERVNITDYHKVSGILKQHKPDCIIHCAAQPSHDYATDHVFADFSTNAVGTLTMLEATKQYCPGAVFIYASTNKVYGDSVNLLGFTEQGTRFDFPKHVQAYWQCVDEDKRIDHSNHSLFGCSKLAADLYVQEYGRRFGIKTVCFRGGCLTGANHQGVALHGFLNYLVKCAMTGEKYTIYGYKGKQVRDNLHASDVASAFYEFYLNPKVAAVYNLGGGRENSCSILEAIELIEKLSGKKVNTEYNDAARYGDHQWYITDMSKFKTAYPEWEMKYSLEEIIKEIIERYEG